MEKVISGRSLYPKEVFDLSEMNFCYREDKRHPGLCIY